jgi:hypothetical protein
VISSSQRPLPDNRKHLQETKSIYEYIGILLGARPMLHISRIKVNVMTTRYGCSVAGKHYTDQTTWNSGHMFVGKSYVTKTKYVDVGNTLSFSPTRWLTYRMSIAQAKEVVRIWAADGEKGAINNGKGNGWTKRHILTQLHLSLNRRGVSWVWISVLGVCNIGNGNDWKKGRILTQLHLSLNRRVKCPGFESRSSEFVTHLDTACYVT